MSDSESEHEETLVEEVRSLAHSIEHLCEGLSALDERVADLEARDDDRHNDDLDTAAITDWGVH